MELKTPEYKVVSKGPNTLTFETIVVTENTLKEAMNKAMSTIDFAQSTDTNTPVTVIIRIIKEDIHNGNSE